MQHPQHAIAQRVDALGVQLPVKKLADPSRNRVRAKIPDPHRRPREPNLTAFGASIMAISSQVSK